MKHKRTIRKLGRNHSQRKALMRSLTVSFFQSRQVTTTERKAKELKRIAEKLITLAKRDTVAGYRQINAFLNHPDSVTKARAIAEKCKERNGGYLQIIKKLPRRGDNARMALVRVMKETP
jgi:large subunit ribosomal protein L17